MDFWSVYEKEKVKADLGSSRLYIASRDRIGLSLSTVERYGSVLGMNQGSVLRFSDEFRYVVVKDLTYDLLVSIYNVNANDAILLRFSEALGDTVVRKITDSVKKLGKPNLEMRMIGLQNTDIELLTSAERLRNATRASLIEVDLFGNETRHIVFDTKLGMSFNLLLLNRIYRPHELLTATTLEEFNHKRSEIKFV